MIPRKVMFEADEGKLIDHFTRDIVGHDRYLRFGSAMSDDAVANYIEFALEDFGTTNMWFVMEDNEEIVATVHVNVNDDKVAEMGFTVAPGYRENGYGQHLFQRGATWAAMKGADTIYTHCLSENKVMQHIAKKNGMSVITVDAGEKEAVVKVNKYVVQAYYEDKFMDNVAFIDRAVDSHTAAMCNLKGIFSLKVKQ